MGKIAGFIVMLAIIAIALTFYKSYLSTQPILPSSTQKQTIDQSSPTSSPLNLPNTQVIANGLEVPWALAFLPDGSILVTERKGTVRLVGTDGRLSPIPIAKFGVKQTGESGLHGIAIHPDFKDNKYVYLYYTYSSDQGDTLNRVSRFIFTGDNLIDEKIIVDKIPGATFHDGGRVKFGPDGYLYITTGDAQDPSHAQDRNSLAGKILRVTDDGKAAPGNPFNSLVYSYGHRNPQGITWDNQGRLWATEHGQTATDEVNLIEAGKNYGWPTIRGDQTANRMLTPKLHSGSSTWAPAGTAFFEGSIYFGGLRGQALYQVKLDTLELKEYFKGEFGRIRDVVLGSDNMLYITTSNRDGRGNPAPDDDKIIKVDPNQL